MSKCKYLSQNLSFLMAKNDLSGAELSNKISVSVAAIQKMRSGQVTNPTIESVMAVAEYFNISIDTLLNELIECQSTITKAGKVPHIKIADAIRFPNCEIINFIDSPEYAVTRNMFAIIIEEKGLIFESGTKLIVDKNIIPKNNNYVIVKNKADIVSLKKVIGDDILYLQSLIMGFENKMLDLENYTVIGVIVSCYRNFLESDR